MKFVVSKSYTNKIHQNDKKNPKFKPMHYKYSLIYKNTVSNRICIHITQHWQSKPWETFGNESYVHIIIYCVTLLYVMYV